MRYAITVRLTALLFAAAVLPIVASAAPDAKPRVNGTPVLLELFTSEGCSSCPPADKLLQTLDRDQPIPNADLIVLSEHVDYWNHSGWSDPYSSAVFSKRQEDYAGKFGLDSVYTPQLIVDGSAQVVGSNASQARAEIAKAIGRPKSPIVLSRVVRNGNQVSAHVEVAAGPQGKGRATIYLALADDEDRSQVTRGENGGRSLTHVAVVRSLTPVATLDSTGFSRDVAISTKSRGKNALRLVVFVQDEASHRIIAVTQQKL